MSHKLEIDVALANLEAGKFSFQMVDAIKGRIVALESELTVLRALQAQAVADLRMREYENWRLEGELRKLNAKINLLLRANKVTEIALRETSALLSALSEQAKAASNNGALTLKAAIADPRLQALLAQMLRPGKGAVALVTKESRTKGVVQFGGWVSQATAEYWEIAKKHGVGLVERVAAYASSLHRTAT